MPDRNILTNLQLAKQFIREVIISGESADTVEMFAEWIDKHADEPKPTDAWHEREPLNIIMRYKAERTSEAEAVAEIRAYVAECMRRANEPSADACDAARYRWLRDDNAYAPEEEMVRGGEGLDKLCDEGIAQNRRAEPAK